ncbi:MAG: LysR family transcriptional regulator [Sedimentitalea sp.]
MDLNLLRDFLCLARTLSFTRAAEERNITQSAFSRRIRALESWMGVALVDRASFPVRLTPAGTQFLPVAKETVATLIDARQAIRDLDQGESTFQRFAVLHTISVNYLAGHITTLEQDIPDLRARVISDSLSTCCQMLADGACDFLLCYRHADVALVLDESQFARQDIGQERMLPVAQHDAAARHGWAMPGTPKRPLPYLAYEPSSFLGTVVDQTIGKRPTHLDKRYVDGLVEAIKRRTLAGSGMAWLPESAIREDLGRGDLVALAARDWDATLDLSLFCSPARLDATGRAVWDSFAQV